MGGSTATIRADNLAFDFKNLSIREIQIWLFFHEKY
jgi:hypothetical protein